MNNHVDKKPETIEEYQAAIKAALYEAGERGLTTEELYARCGVKPGWSRVVFGVAARELLDKVYIIVKTGYASGRRWVMPEYSRSAYIEEFRREV